jgi:NADH:ubiquinone oxidoreductase subunit 2 (subunit N)
MKYKKEIIIIVIAVVISSLISFGFYLKTDKRIGFEKCFIWYQLNGQQKDLGTYLQDCERIDNLFN